MSRLVPIFSALIAALSLTSATPVSTPSPYRIPTVEEAAYSARLLLLTETLATLSTIYPAPIDSSKPYQPPPELAGYPVGLIDYYADCSSPFTSTTSFSSKSLPPPATATPGNPTLLSLRIATSFKNVAAGSPISLSIHKVTPRRSAASQPRLALMGKLKPVTASAAEQVLKCFTKRHPDARWWTPGNKIHESEWVEMDVEGVYWIGGFGDRAYIGWIPVETWRGVVLKEEDVWRAWEERGKLGVGLEGGEVVKLAPEQVVYRSEEEL
ncbi:pyridoxamine 5'-phosphate oxidase-domain-containing protein [Tirmania nivea]|nr:pyridoxamine 5'-phosphate oxidase-domain-containing protein [Tirmania nivea]